MNILIVGDSFAADWTIKYPEQKGWPNLLAETYTVTNLAQAGCSEYKIWLQLARTNVSKYTHIIVSHTSPYRIPVVEHPIHKNDLLHKNCDLLYLDIKENGQFPDLEKYFEQYFDIDYADFVYNLIVEKEINYLKDFSGKVLHISFNQKKHKQFQSFERYFKKYQGFTNHLNGQGNQIIFEKIKEWIKNAS